MRTVYLVTYDVTDDARLRQVFKVMRRFGDHLQYSVFRCVLSEREKIRMSAALTEVINCREDQVLIADLGPEEGRGDESISSLGRVYTHPERYAVVL